MKIVLHSVILFFSFITLSLFSQNKLVVSTAAQKVIVKKPDTVFCDCPKARVVKLSGSQKIGVTIAPPGFGELQEITSARLKTKFAFEKEHHTAWYKLFINSTGNLSFDITPEKPDDDYDFMLFQSGKNNFCDSLVKNRIKPERANISRDKTELSGKTGLSVNAKNEEVKEGVNDAYSQSLPVAKGEIYYLVLDNVYEKGGGHTIEFFFEQKVNLMGVVKNDEGQPLITNVTITNLKGETIAETTSDAKTGEYEIHTALRKSYTYSINYFNDSSFIYSKTISLKDTVELKNIKVVLPKLKRGKKYTIGAINFVGGLPEYLSSSLPSMENLNKLMRKNKNLKILIEGHTNGCDKGVQLLSELRAQAIKEYLVKNEIANTRIETIGKGCSEMLFPKMKTEREQEQNRRVEIKVLEY